MATATIDLTAGRKIIAKLRKIADKREAFSLEHIRTRKTASTPEFNSYTLRTSSGAIATVYTNAGLVEWAPDYRELLAV